MVAGALLGLVLAPRRILAAYRASSEYAALLAMSVGELRALLGVPAEGIARHPRLRHGMRTTSPA